MDRENDMPRRNERERYALGYSDKVLEWLRRRSVKTHATFLLPHLHSGMRVLDCGCGPGSLTLDLARLVTPGSVIGLDIEGAQFAYAQELARTEGIENVSFEVGSAYELPFEDESFDLVFAHATLFHLSDPGRALREFQRVLKIGGLIAVRDTDYSTWQLEPETPLLAQMRELILKYMQTRGASPTYARRMRSYLVDAGFTRTEAYASCVSNGTPERVRTSASTYLGYLQAPDILIAIKEQDERSVGSISSDELEAIRAEVHAWSERPDAFELLIWREGLAWRDK
ncbi:methyltransferase domain-containing protein [Ktedonobacter racemifer]|uniref:Methyltransferase type 11 n=1 Tax=Ktedonobacter racemifer DSM 44963 TaxID=485913 RepID=D6TZ56_KTERA|nr:methyltransferase domain-containing protein [Ktedonobacter racemifer]EFH81846.1 Methyltransferase type 11 [Ktedonobacter racemifer DSM 44963]